MCIQVVHFRIESRNDLACLHFPYSKKKSTRESKITECKATFSLVCYAPNSYETKDERKTATRRLNRDPYYESHPTELSIEWNHDHSVGIPSQLRWKRISEDMKKEMKHFLQDHCSPAAACRAYENRLELKEMDDEAKELLTFSDRSVNPTLRDWYYLAMKLSLTEHGKQTGEDMETKLIEFCNEQPEKRKFASWDKKVTGKKGKIETIHEWCVVLQTEFMERLYTKLTKCRDVVFTDSTASVDMLNTSMTLLCVSTSIGAMPIAIAIHNKQSVSCYTKVFQFVKDLLMEEPKAFITDDSDAERAALRNVFPSAILLLCIFHVLQALWRWLITLDNGVTDKLAVHKCKFLYLYLLLYLSNGIFAVFKKCCYAESTFDFEKHWKELEGLAALSCSAKSSTEGLSKLQHHLQGYFNIKDSWAKVFRPKSAKFATTNNLVERMVR